MRPIQFFCKTFFVGLLIAFCGISVRAQYEDGSLIGAIHDATGAAVANAAVTVTNVNTGIIDKLTANGSGDYEAPSLRVGIYDIEASAPGFAPAEAKNITISVGMRLRIDLTLNVGQAGATTVEVSDVALQLETASSNRGQTITGYQTEALPLVSRNYSDLVDYVTGSRPAPAEAMTTAVTSLERAGSFNINGQRSMFNNYMLDGMDNNAYSESNQGFDNQIIAPPPDSIAQFEVVTNNYSAEYGRSSGALVNVATRSGANQFHTTLYEFLRNTDLNAAGYIKPIVTNPITGQPYPFVKPGFDRNQFGANFAGAIVKNKLFYFLDYEGFRQTLTPTVFGTVPTTNELNGILTVAVQDPWHPGTYLPAGTSILSNPDIDPTALVIANYYKNVLPAQCQILTGTGTNGSLGEASNNCATNAPFTDNADKGDLRIDFQQNEKSSWFLKISDRKETGINFPSLPEPIDMQTNGVIKIHDEQAALGYNRQIGSNKFLDARLALSGTSAGKWSKAIGTTFITPSEIPGLPTIANVSGGLPSIAISGGFTSFGRQSTNPQWQNPSVLNPKLNFSWLKGKHSVKTGFEYSYIWMEVEDSNPLYGSFTFNHGYSLCPTTAGAACPITGSYYTTAATSNSAVTDTYWADFLFGASGNYSLSTYWISHLHQDMYNWYVQDDWKVSPKLTLNLGVRWEYGSPYSERNNDLSNFNPATGSMLTLTPNYTGSTTNCGVNPCIAPFSGSGVYGKTLVNPDLDDYAPRIGFAYELTPTIALRGGYGTSFVHYYRAGSGNMLAINAPNAMFTNVTNPSPSATACGGPCSLDLTPGYVRVSQGYPAGLATTFSAGTDNIDYIPQNTKDSSVESYFLSVQKSLGKNIIVDVAYVGNHGIHLQGFINANQKNPANGFARPYPNWGGYLLNNSTTYPTFLNGDITEALNEFHSRYNSLQARYEQRFVEGLTLLNSFTWSQSLDNASSVLDANTPAPQDGNNLQADYGQSDYNLPVANVTTLVYDLPFGKGRRYLEHSNSVENAVVGGWQLSAINTMQGGTPFNITYTPAAANQVSPTLTQSWRGQNLYRPNLVPGTPYHFGKKNLTSSGTVQYVNLAALTLPSTYVNNNSADGLFSPFGNLPRNYGRTPKFYETDLALNKRFNTPSERMKVEFRSEFYNIFNHTNLYMPGSGEGGGTVTGTNGGAVTGGSGGTISQTWEPRIIQFALKIIY
jgi:outer membrane receptor protein involved in Fe transport